jgi:hypothetical protein
MKMENKIPQCFQSGTTRLEFLQLYQTPPQNQRQAPEIIFIFEIDRVGLKCRHRRTNTVRNGDEFLNLHGGETNG